MPGTPQKDSDQFIGYAKAIEDHIFNASEKLRTQEHRIFNLSKDLNDELEDIAREIHMIREGLNSGAYEIKSAWEKHESHLQICKR